MGVIQQLSNRADSPPSIVAVGQTTIDTVHLDGNRPSIHVGGSAYIPARILAESGVRVGLVCCLGEGLSPADLWTENLDLSGVLKVPGPSSSVELHYSNQNLAALKINAAASDALSMSQVPSEYFNANLFYLSPAPMDFLLELTEAASARRITIAFSPKEDFPTFADRKMREILSRCQFCFLNERELFFITDINEESSAIAAVHEAGPQVILLTRGRRGVTISSRLSTPFHMTPSRVVDTVNPIGAGDCFAAVFLAQTVSGHSLRESAATAMRHTERWLINRDQSSYWEAKRL
jgi:sugar/nucleoside kinase (ribokinase family)